MKKTLMLATTLLLAFALATPALAKGKIGKTRFAKKGTWTAAGDVHFDYRSTEPDGGQETTMTDFLLAPMVGWFVIDGLELRLGPTIQIGSMEAGNEETDMTEYGAKFGAKYYFPIQGTLFVNAGAAFGYATGKNVDLMIGGESSGFDIDLGAGLTLVFGSKYGGFVSLDAIYTYQSRTQDNGAEVEYSGNNFGIGTTLGVFF